MKETLAWFLLRWRYAYLPLALLLVAVPVSLFYVTGSFEPGVRPYYFDSDREFLGMLLMMSILPAYCASCLIYSHRRTTELAAGLSAQLQQSVKTISPAWIAGFAFAGVIWAVIFNVPDYGLTFFSADAVGKTMIIAQISLWCLVAALLSVRFHVARSFNRFSQQVPVDIFEPTSLRPFAQTGLIDVLIISGGMIISTFQSLDFTFRPDNYVNAMAVAIPSMLFLALYPMWTIHKRMVDDRQRQLEELNHLIERAPRALEQSEMQSLELLLQRRERVQSAHTWPIDLGIVQRFLFYVIIPPLAWIGAALVEALIDRLVLT